MPGRTPRQCRHRYYNYLVDSHQYSAWTDAEEKLIFDKFQEVGPKWVQIAGFLCGRTGNDVKNRWHKHIAKKYIEERGNPSREENSLEIEGEVPSVVGTAGKGGLSAFLKTVLN
jgi:hypothetical protein